ncbi:MAG: MoxR-like ATPase [Planctomycetota bacterium]
MSDLQALDAEIQDLREAVKAFRQSLEERFIGQSETVELLILALLAGGHVLLEGAPGLGKTTLVQSLSDAVDLSFQRLQCTPDLMPSDVLGTRVLRVNEETGARSFDFEPGPVFTNVLLADEVNRATPRTQSALLEAMQEAQVTLHGKTHILEPPFFVVATQNPIEMEGTYPLPEAQLDRFLFKLEIALPSEKELTRILDATTGERPGPLPVSLSREQLLRLQAIVRQIPAPSTVVEAVSRIVLGTHPNHPDAIEDVRNYVRHGASLRAGQSILLAAKARALMAGRLHVAELDLRAVARAALKHRVILSYEGEATGLDLGALVEAVVEAAI